jgi:hypothetical protein
MEAGAQSVMIAPNAVVIDGRSRTGVVTLVNSGDRAAEISISSLFGFPATDSAGRMRLETFATVDDTMPSASAWLRAFPERFVLAPGARRTVRLLVTPPAGIPDREYWARLVVSSRAARDAAPAGADTVAADTHTDMRVGLALEVRSILGVFYRRGALATGVRLDSARAFVEGDSIVTRVRMTRTGNAAFVGTLRGVIRDSTGAARATMTLPLGVYYTLEPRLSAPLGKLAAGKYTVDLDVQAARPDVPAGMLLPVAPTRAAAALDIPRSLAGRPNDP